MADDETPTVPDAAPRKPAAERRRHLYPTGTHVIPGVPQRELLVSSEDAQWILGHEPAAFTASPPEGYDPMPYADALELDDEGHPIPLEWSRPEPAEEA